MPDVPHAVEVIEGVLDDLYQGFPDGTTDIEGSVMSRLRGAVNLLGGDWIPPDPAIVLPAKENDMAGIKVEPIYDGDPDAPDATPDRIGVRLTAQIAVAGGSGPGLGTLVEIDVLAPHDAALFGHLGDVLQSGYSPPPPTGTERSGP